MHEERKPPPPIRLTEDDLLIMRHLQHYRYLQSRQVFTLMSHRNQRRLYTRLQRLTEHGYLKRLNRSLTNFIRTDHAYCLASKGFDEVRYHFDGELPLEGLESPQLGRVRAFYLHHNILINDVRIAVEEALKDHSRYALARWASEFELEESGGKIEEKNYLLKRKYKLDGKYYSFAPDAAFFVHPRDTPEKQRMYCLEIDRGTESIASRIRQKVKGIQGFYWKQDYRRFDHVAGMRVLFVIQTKTGRRAENIRQVLEEAKDLDDVRNLIFYSRQDEISPEKVFEEAIWMNSEGKKIALFKQSK